MVASGSGNNGVEASWSGGLAVPPVRLPLDQLMMPSWSATPSWWLWYHRVKGLVVVAMVAASVRAAWSGKRGFC